MIRNIHRIAANLILGRVRTGVRRRSTALQRRRFGPTPYELFMTYGIDREKKGVFLALRGYILTIKHH
jgi:hypothetical protein